MVKLKIIAVLLITAFCICCLFSCGRGGITEDYRDSPFEATVVLCRGSSSWEARITVGDDAAEQRDIRIELLSPETLSGISIYRENGEVYAQYGDLRMSGSSFGHILEFADIIIPKGEMELVGKSDIGEKRILCASTTSGHEIYLNAETLEPVEIRIGDMAVKIKDFKKSGGKNEGAYDDLVT